MKTILELSPQRRTLYTLPDELFDILTRMLADPINRVWTRSGRCRSPGVKDILRLFPEAWRADIKTEIVEI